MVTSQKTMIRITLHCPNCQSESVIEHEMDDQNYPHSDDRYVIQHCPFCGDEIDYELQCEEEENDY